MKETIVLVANKLNSINVKWILGGSGSLYVQGVDVLPKDLDIMTTFTDENKIISLLNEYQVFEGEESFFVINGVKIEVIAWSEEKFGKPTPVLFENTSIPVFTLDQELTFYKNRTGTEKVTRLIEEKLSSAEGGN